MVAIKDLNGSLSLLPVWMSFIDMLTTAIPATDLVTPLSIFKERSLRG